MVYNRWLKPKFLFLTPLLLVLVIAVACGDDAAPVIIEKEVPVEVIKEVPVEVIKEVQVVKEVVVEKEVIKEVILIATPTPTPTGPQVVQPKYGGIIRVLEENEAPTLDIHRSIFGFFEYLGNVHNTILRYDHQNPDTIIPDLANRWELSADNRTYSFHFPAGVKWHDGVPFTAKDAEVSVLRMMEYSNKLANIRTVVKVEATDDLTLEITLERPTPSFVRGIALGTMPIAAKHIIDEQGEKGLTEVFIGTGPFTFVKYDRGEVFEIARNPDYFKEGLPYLDGARFLFIKEENTASAAFKTGRLDLAAIYGRVTETQARDIRRAIPGLQQWEFDWLQGPQLTIQTEKPPWDDVRLRRAAFLAIDRQSAIKIADQGGRVGVAQFQGEFAYPDLINLPGIRPEKDEDRAAARKLMAEAGFPNGFDTKVMAISTVTQHMTMAVFFADQLSLIGINAKVDALDVPTYIDRALAGDFELEAIYGSINFPDPDAMFKILNPEGIFSKLVNAELAGLMEAQSIESDAAKRIEIVHNIQRLMIEEVPYVFTHWVTPPTIAQPYVRNFQPPIGLKSQGGYLEKIWLDK